MRTVLVCGLLASLVPVPSFAQPARPAPSPSPAAAASPAPKPPPTPVLEGVVRGPDGKPVADALVGARLAAAGPQDFPVTGRTDAAGAFRLRMARLSLYVLRVEARGFAGRTLEKVRPGTPLTIALDKGGFIQGTVRDGTTGQPIPGARVRTGDASAATFFTDEPDAGRVETTTDGQGRFRLEGLASGLQTVSATSRGYGRVRKGSVHLGATIELLLFPGAALRGVVRGPGGRPVAGATVRAEADIVRPGLAASPEATDTQGRFEISGLEPGTYRVIAFKKGMAPGTASGIAVERSGDVDVDIALEPGTRVHGRLVGAEGEGVAGLVVLRELDGKPVRFLAELLRADAGADGRFAIDTVPPGAHALGVTAPGYGAKRVEVEVGRADREIDLGEVPLESGLTIRGRVRDRAGVGVAEATIRGFQPRMLSGGFPDTRSEADGSFVLAGLEPGNVRLNVSAAGYGALDRTVESGSENVDIVLKAAGTISGLVVDDADRPVDAYQVTARPVRQSPMLMLAPRSTNNTSPDGRFLLEDVAEGSYTVQVTAPDRAAGVVSDVKVTAGGSVDLGRIRLVSGGIVRGTVVDTGGTPLPGASVVVRGPGRDFLAGRDAREALTDSSGAFELRGVAAGAGEAVATHPNYAEGRVGIEVDPAKGPTEARIVLTQGGRVEGLVRRRDGSAVAGAYVQVTPTGRSGGFILNPSMIPVGADGSFVVDHLPAGRTAVLLMNRSGDRFTSGQSKEVDVREGQTTTVEFQSRDILVSGRVTRSGTPYPNLRLRVVSASGLTMTFALGPGVPAGSAGAQRMGAVTREDGGYEMIVDQPGSLQLVAETLDGRTHYPGRNVEVPDADTYALDLDFSGVTVAGVVVDKDTEAPVTDANVLAVPKDAKTGSRGGSGATGADGHFQLELDPGDYRVTARAERYGSTTVDVSVSSGGAPDVRLALSRGFGISGRIVDALGRPMGALSVTAASSDVGAAGSWASSTSLPDGSFEITGLDARPYNLLAASELGSFAVQPGVAPGDKDVLLTLKRGGRVRVHAVGPGDVPVEGLFASVTRVSGARVSGLGGFARTDAQGMVELVVPQGVIEISSANDQLAGKATVAVPEGATVPLVLRLGPSPRRREEKTEERKVIGGR
jgi:protocatechuate 3,4-dioxygenase beta subunit